uniref:Major facilitator superfamily (MFS) profile domain-containing protein n=1 Tax=Panagrolaimus superbus TaxID=310955 RepID=A0A914Z2R2_9BILA
MPFLPLYVEQLGVTGHSALNMWSGIVFSITFLFSAIASPFWGGLADRKGRKLMLLRSALGMGIVMVLMGLAQNIWQFLILRALLGLLGGFVPNANALIATQVPRNKSGWALGTLSTGGVSGALLGPMAGGLLADSYGLRPVFFITASGDGLNCPHSDAWHDRLGARRGGSAKCTTTRQTWRSNRTRKDPDYSADLFCTAVDPNVLRSDAIATWDFTFFARCRRWCTTPRRTDTVGLQLEQPDRRAYLQL